MATFTAISEKTQSATAMKRVIDYVVQDKKTMFYDEQAKQSYKLISGQNCVAETAYEEFMATKHQYNKAKGVFFKQYVQSFKPDCRKTPQEIHATMVSSNDNGRKKKKHTPKTESHDKKKKHNLDHDYDISL